MIDRTQHVESVENLQRRKVLQGAVAIAVAGVVPAVSAGVVNNNTGPALSGKLVCNIADPVKTLVLRNHSDQAIVLDHLSKSALMFDGSIVDCNNACLAQPVSIPAHEEVEIRFPRHHPQAVVHRVEDYQRVQSRVTRLSDGTREIRFTAVVKGSSAVFV